MVTNLDEGYETKWDMGQDKGEGEHAEGGRETFSEEMILELNYVG